MALTRQTRRSLINASASNDREVSEYDGVWLNIGINVKDEDTGETNFIRLPLGVAVADIAKKKRTIHANTLRDNPEYAARVAYENEMIDQICAAALSMEAGESMPTNTLDVQLFKKNEEVETSVEEGTKPQFSLFG